MRFVTNNQITNNTKQPSQIKHSLRRYPPNIFVKNPNRINHFSRNPIEGISALSFNNRISKASMSLEAAIVLPLFIFFFVNLLSVIEIYRVHSTLLYALSETGKQLTTYGYAYDMVFDEEEDTGIEALIENVAFTEIYVRNKVESMMGDEYLEHSPIIKGKEGIYYFESSIMQHDDVIDLTAIYQVSPFIDLIGFQRAGFYTRYYGRAWTGYNLKNQKEKNTEQLVYVTDYGTAYHEASNCPVLDLSIETITGSDIVRRRNVKGEKYIPCDVCARIKRDDTVYITKYGNHYHLDKQCIGLKRSIRKIPLSEAMPRYHKCGRCCK